MGKLFNRLLEYSLENVYPLHMPGHKRSLSYLNDIYKFDITEIHDFDDLHSPTGILKDAQERASALYKSEHTYFLVNGSTLGILSGVSAISNRGDTLIIARNCHKSIYNAAYVNGLKLRYVYPEYDSKYGIDTVVSPKALALSIASVLNEGLKIAGIVVTSPTYEGIASDIGSLSMIAHDNNIPLIVDEAHGAHFGFSKYYPDSSVHCGADIVVHSVHKTLPAPTQTAIMHINGDIVRPDLVERFLDIYETSSPSYILMAGIDEAIEYVKENGEEQLNRLYDYRNDLNDYIKELTHIDTCILSEPGKLLIYAEGMSGIEISDFLREKFNIEVEMSMPNYALGILTMMDTKEGFERIKAALKSLDERIALKEKSVECMLGNNTDFDINVSKVRRNVPLIEYYLAYDMKTEELLLEKAADRICGSRIMLYPPGSPILVPGEMVTQDILGEINKLISSGFDVRGIEDGKIKVII